MQKLKDPYQLSLCHERSQKIAFLKVALKSDINSKVPCNVGVQKINYRFIL